MGLPLLLDEDTQAKRPVALLREAGHDAQTVTEALLTDQSDAAVLSYARRQGRLVLTRNCGDLQALHKAGPSHPGILGIFQYNNPDKDMSYPDIVAAIANLQASGWAFAGEFIVLNQWHFPPGQRQE